MKNFHLCFPLNETMKQKNPWVYISVVLAMIMWSLTFVWFKIVNEVIGPFTIVFLRLLISSIILLLVSWLAGLLQRIRGRDIYNFVILSTIYPVIYFIAESLGLTLIQASLAAVIISTIPLFVPVGAYILYRERLSALNIVGVIISFVGVLIVVLKPDLSFNAAPADGPGRAGSRWLHPDGQKDDRKIQRLQHYHLSKHIRYNPFPATFPGF